MKNAYIVMKLISNVETKFREMQPKNLDQSEKTNFYVFTKLILVLIGFTGE